MIREQCKHGDRSDEEEAISSGSWKELSEVYDDCNIQERLDEANQTKWEVHDSVVDESNSTVEDCHYRENEVHEEEDV